jgi:hypothetical protein
MRKLLIALAVVLVLAGLAVAVLWVALGRVEGIVKQEIERQGTKIAGTPVTVRSVDLAPLSGEGTINDFAVTNPEGFSGTPALLDVQRASVKLDPWSVLADDGPVVVHDVEIRDATLSVEASLAAMGSNLGTLKRSVTDYREERDASNAAPRRRIKVARLTTKNVQVVVMFHGPLRTFTRTIRLDDIELRDVGGAEGALPEELAREIVTAVSREAKAAIARSPGPLKEFRNKLLERLDEKGGAGLEGLRETGEGLIDGIRNGDITSFRDLRDALKRQLSGADAGAAADGGPADAGDGGAAPDGIRSDLQQTREKVQGMRESLQQLKRARDERRRGTDDSSATP